MHNLCHPMPCSYVKPRLVMELPPKRNARATEPLDPFLLADLNRRTAKHAQPEHMYLLLACTMNRTPVGIATVFQLLTTCAACPPATWGCGAAESLLTRQRVSADPGQLPVPTHPRKDYETSINSKCCISCAKSSESGQVRHMVYRLRHAPQDER